MDASGSVDPIPCGCSTAFRAPRPDAGWPLRILSPQAHFQEVFKMAMPVRSSALFRFARNLSAAATVLTMLAAPCSANADEAFLASCTLPAKGICQDLNNIKGATAVDLKPGCDAVGGTWSASPCPHAGMLGGCRIVQSDSGGRQWTQTMWWPESNPWAERMRENCKTGWVTP
jgi:hypothetical protein